MILTDALQLVPIADIQGILLVPDPAWVGRLLRGSAREGYVPARVFGNFTGDEDRPPEWYVEDPTYWMLTGKAPVALVLADRGFQVPEGLDRLHRVARHADPKWPFHPPSGWDITDKITALTVSFVSRAAAIGLGNVILLGDGGRALTSSGAPHA